MRKFILLLTLCVGCTIVAQEKLNAYKYVVVPSRFDFQKDNDQYGLNTLLKYKFQQLGFKAYLDSEDLPRELKVNSCIYISPSVKHKSTMIYTKISVEILDCDKQVLYITQEGKSKSKSYRTSNIEALRNALKSFDGYKLNFKSTTKGTLPIEENQVVRNEIVKEDKPVVVLPSGSVNSKFLYKGTQFSFEKKNQLFYTEIKNSKTNEWSGKISKTSKKGIFHVFLNSKNGVGYYDETGNFIIEFLESDGNVSLHRFQLLN